jgi:uncharacterized protein YjiS (DUF1127 family)
MIRISIDFPARSHLAFHDARHRWSLDTLVAWIRSALERSKQRRALAELDDRALRDIGISRSEALYEAGKPFWRR